MNKLIACIILFFIPFAQNAQEFPPHARNYTYKFDHFDLESGLSQATVQCIFQDSRGFLWIGTEDGLNRFDGYEFKVFRNNPFDSTSLSYNDISSIEEDQEGNLWIGTYGGGLNQFDPFQEKFTVYRQNGDDQNSISSNVILKIFKDENERLWITTANTNEGQGMLHQFLKDENRFQQYSITFDGITTNNSRALAQDMYGNLWVGTAEGIFVFNPDQEKFITNIRHDPLEKNTIGNNSVMSILVTENGKIWIARSGFPGGGISRIDVLNNEYELRVRNYYQDLNKVITDQSSLIDNNTRDLVKSADGKIWIATGWGISVYDPVKDNFENIKYNSLNTSSIMENDIRSILKDRSGTIWIGYASKGLSKLSSNKGFLHIGKSDIDGQSLITNNVFAIQQDDAGNIWVGSLEGGLNKVVFDRNNFAGPYSITQYRQGTSRKTMAHPDIFSISDGSDGSLWIGTLGGGLYHFDPTTEEFDIYGFDPSNPYSLQNNGVRTTFVAADQSLWTGTNDGLFKSDVDQGGNRKFLKLIPAADNPSSYKHASIASITEDKMGHLWVSSQSGAVYYMNAENKFSMVLQPDRPMKLFSSKFDSKGLLWLCTNVGLFSYQIEPDASLGVRLTLLKFYDSNNSALPNSSIYKILEDIHGDLWLSHVKGISRLSREDNSFINYSVEDGLQSNEFNSNAGCNLENGYLCFGGINGINIFHPDSLKHNLTVPPVVITQFNILNEPRELMKNGYTLSYLENTLSFEFASLDFTAPQKNRYSYQMVGFDKDWIDSGSRRNISYTNLDPGTYTFRVRGTNNDGVWNEQGASMEIIILPPPWRTWWAYSLYGLGIILLLLAVRRQIISRERLKARIKLEQLEISKYQELDLMKSRFFANISHEFRTPLTLLLGPIDKRIQAAKDPAEKSELQQMYRNASRLLNLVNQLLDLSKKEASAMKLSCVYGELQTAVSLISSQFFSIAASKEITFKISEDVRVIMYYDQDKLEKIVGNLLSNSFKYTPEGGQIAIEILKAAPDAQFPDGCAILNVSDSGIGISEEELGKIFDLFYQVDLSSTREFEGSGVGLSLTKELVELHHGTIEVQSVPGKGSTFTVRLPLGRSHLNDDEISVQISEDVVGSPENAGDQINDSGHLPVGSLQQDTILIIEDNLDLRHYIRSELSDTYAMLEAKDGQEGIAAAIRELPTLIITDLMMPLKDGLTVCQELKADERTCHIPIILLTAKVDIETKLKGYQFGADEYIPKPFKVNELLIRIENLLFNRKLVREKYTREITINPTSVIVESMDERFIQKTMEIIEERLAETDFGVEDLARDLGVSYTQLYRKMDATTGFSPNELIRHMRLLRAADLMRQQAGNVGDIAFLVGFNNLSYFSKVFKEKFGLTPIEYLKNPPPAGH
ncbi:hybrid sensor histidine kinase/response regulator transcription factor [Fulvivirga sedimenti]|uniref:histidine kinase n=1 Tax=Fulvivirga sedimenti TaxID=2879465 RepID=A0A9X1KXM1_9BACT|nr:two-component regulator propeller domain-containing protein [Fulvivirga sedimenti]MCA6074753.1 helix-turn-helix domain-containing protein [Fulvivirga sedimenti]MCA6075930.1 helix-turn-helix domain-containing protein [Fulvivirga sedimenti]MCA6077058.1 helix-turn-helix domain-containing protein [Fulvivirga sedimenti]